MGEGIFCSVFLGILTCVSFLCAITFLILYTVELVESNEHTRNLYYFIGCFALFCFCLPSFVDAMKFNCNYEQMKIDLIIYQNKKEEANENEKNKVYTVTDFNGAIHENLTNGKFIANNVAEFTTDDSDKIYFVGNYTIKEFDKE